MSDEVVKILKQMKKDKCEEQKGFGGERMSEDVEKEVLSILKSIRNQFQKDYEMLKNIDLGSRVRREKVFALDEAIVALEQKQNFKKKKFEAYILGIIHSANWLCDYQDQPSMAKDMVKELLQGHEKEMKRVIKKEGILLHEEVLELMK